MSKLFLDIFNISVAASWMIAAVMIVRLLLKKRAPKWTACLLWVIVGIKLVLPFSFESDLSLLPSRETVNTDAVYEAVAPTENNTPDVGTQTPSVPHHPQNNENRKPTQYFDSGFQAIDDRVNEAITETVAQTPAEAENPLKALTDIACTVWICGMAAMTVYAIANYILLRRRIAVSVPYENGIRRSEAVGSPFILGMFRPKIYLPFGLSAETEMHVIAHERAHLRRCDHLIKPFSYALLTIYWFNPFVWAAYILLCRDIEMACDEKVVKHMSEDARKAYAASLLECGIKHSIIAACPVAFGEVGVKQRVKNALNYKKPMFWIIIAAVIVCIAVAVFFLTSPTSNEPSQEPQTSDEADTSADKIMGEIEFGEYYFDAYLTEYKCNVFPEPMTTFTAKTAEEFARICSTTGDEKFLKFASSLPDDFFDDNMLIFAYSWLTPSTIVDIADIYAGEDAVTVNVTYEQTSVKENSYTRLIVASVKKTDAGGYEIYQTKHTPLAEIYVPNIENKTDHTLYTFGGSYNYTGSFVCPGINPAIKISDRTELDAFLAEYESPTDGIGADMKEFAKSLHDDFFETKALIIIHKALPANGTTVSGVYSDKDYLMLCASMDLYEEHYSNRTAIYAAEINKDDIAEGAKIRCFIQYNEYANEGTPIEIQHTECLLYYSLSAENADFSKLRTDSGESIPYIIDTQEKLNEFINEFAPDKNKSLSEYIQTLPVGFFTENALIVNYVYSSSTPANFTVTDIRRYYDRLVTDIACDLYGAADTAVQENLLISSVKKLDIEGCNRFKSRKSDLTGISYYADVLQTYSLMAKYLFTDDYESYIDSPIFECPDPDEELQYRWSCMISNSIQYHSRAEFGYTLKDINNDNIPELFLLEKYDTIKAIFTYDIKNGKAKLLDAFWNRYNCRLLENGDIYTMGSSGWDIIKYEIRRLDQNCELWLVDGFGSDRDENDNVYYYTCDVGTTTIIDEEYIDIKVSSYPSFEENTVADGAMYLIDSFYPIDYDPFGLIHNDTIKP